jgi:tetratricopeptide (TPR) repeat protein
VVLAADPARVVQVQAVKPDGRSVGSGYAIGGRAILTAGHVVSEYVTDGPVRPFGQVKVHFPVDGSQGSGDWWACETTWLRNDPEADAALVTITDPSWPADAESEPIRWGQLTGSRAGVPCEVISYPRVQKDGAGRRDTEHLLGHINPGTAALARKYEISVDDSVAGTLSGNKSPWAGASGGAVICGSPVALVAGVVREDRANFAHGRLTATPVSELARDESFCSAIRDCTGRDLLVESAELAPLFASPHPRADFRSASFLLRADVEAVRFRGRDEIIGWLRDWCEGKGSAVCLLAGTGGQGKTRLARRLVADLCRDGWAGGELPSADAMPESSKGLLADTRIPLLVVIDQAEARPEVARSVAERLGGRDQQAPTRILLLARESGEWWQRLIASSPAFADAREYRLGPLDNDADSRREAFSVAVHDLAAYLGRVPGYREADWPTIARTVSPPDDLAGARFESALAVQLTALTALLERRAGPPAQGPETSPEDTLLAQEQEYWQQSAARFGLGLNPHTLERAVATAVLYGAESKGEALETLARVDGLHDARYDERESAAQWIRELYPAASKSYWGSLQPDRIAEHLVATVLQDSPDLLDRSLPGATSGQQQRALLIFCRCEAPYKQRWFTLIRLLGSHWKEIATSLIDVAVRAEDPRPLPEALLEFIKERPDLTRDQLAELSGAIPRPSRWLQQATVLLSERIAEQSQDPAELAEALNNLSGDLAAVGRTSDAQRAAGRAVQICNQLVMPKGKLRKHGPPLEMLDLQQRVLQTFADRLVDIGVTGSAIVPVRQSITISRELAAADPKYQLSYANSVSHLSQILTRMDSQGGLEAARQAADLYGQLADGEQKSAGQARTLLRMASNLLNLQRDQDAVATAEQATAKFRALAEANPGTYLPELAQAWQSLSLIYMKSQQFQQARDAAEENVRCRRRLSGNPLPPYLPVPYLPPGLPQLSAGLYLLSRALYYLGETESALEAARAAAEIDDDLSTPLIGSDRHLPVKAVTTIWLGTMLQANGQSESAATTLISGFQLAERLGQEGLVAEAATELRAIHSHDAAVVESAWLKIAGSAPLPAALISGNQG